MMATQAEIQHRLSYARAMLERGIPVASLATMICARYFVSRSTAYSDITAAFTAQRLNADSSNFPKNPVLFHP